MGIEEAVDWCLLRWQDFLCNHFVAILIGIGGVTSFAVFQYGGMIWTNSYLKKHGVPVPLRSNKAYRQCQPRFPSSVCAQVSEHTQNESKGDNTTRLIRICIASRVESTTYMEHFFGYCFATIVAYASSLLFSVVVTLAVAVAAIAVVVAVDDAVVADVVCAGGDEDHHHHDHCILSIGAQLAVNRHKNCKAQKTPAGSCSPSSQKSQIVRSSPNRPTRSMGLHIVVSIKVAGDLYRGLRYRHLAQSVRLRVGASNWGLSEVCHIS